MQHCWENLHGFAWCFNHIRLYTDRHIYNWTDENMNLDGWEKNEDALKDPNNWWKYVKRDSGFDKKGTRNIGTSHFDWLIFGTANQSWGCTYLPAQYLHLMWLKGKYTYSYLKDKGMLRFTPITSKE